MKQFTVREIADLLRVSKTTIQKYIKAANIEYDCIEKNKQYYSYQKAKEIIKNIRPDFDFSELENLQTEVENSETKLENQNENLQTEVEKSKNQVENSQTEVEKSKTEVENSPTQQNEQMATLNRMLDMIQKQLEEKDKQLAIKDKQIQDLSDRLQEAMELTKGQQYIAAADKTAQLLEAEQQPKEDTVSEDITTQEPPQKKGFFSRFFNK